MMKLANIFIEQLKSFLCIFKKKLFINIFKSYFSSDFFINLYVVLVIWSDIH